MTAQRPSHSSRPTTTHSWGGSTPTTMTRHGTQWFHVQRQRGRWLREVRNGNNGSVDGGDIKTMRRHGRWRNKQRRHQNNETTWWTMTKRTAAASKQWDDMVDDDDVDDDDVCTYCFRFESRRWKIVSDLKVICTTTLIPNFNLPRNINEFIGNRGCHVRQSNRGWNAKWCHLLLLERKPLSVLLRFDGEVLWMVTS